MNPVIDARPTQNEHRHRGIGRYVSGMIVALARRGRVHRLLAHGDRPLPAEVHDWPLTVSLRPHALRYHFGWAVDEVLIPLSARTGRWKQFHATDPDAIPDGRVVPTIATVYDLTPMKDEAVWRQLTVDQRIGYRRMVTNVTQARGVITISEAVACDIREHLAVATERVHVVYPWIDLATWPFRDGRRAGLLFVGAPGANKNIEGLIAALGRIRSAPLLTIAGPWPPAARQHVARRASEFGVKIAVEPYVSDERLRELFARSALFVMPSREEGFGLPLLEAMASGCPAVVSDAPALVEVSDGAAWVTPRGDTEALAHSIEDLLADDSARANLAALGRRRAAAFTWASSAAALEAAYQGTA